MSSVMEEFLILVVLSGSLSILHAYHYIPSIHDVHFPACSMCPLYPMFEYEYYQGGDLIIGGLFSVYKSIDRMKVRDGVYEFMYYCSLLDTSEYDILLAFFFAIDEINKDPNLLPNITVGYHLFDTCGYPIKALDSVMKILSGYKRKAPNYSCIEKAEITGFVGDATFPTTFAVAELLNIYQYTQISHRVTDPLLSDRGKFPNFYRTVPSSLVWYKMVIKVLNIFSWNWVGIIVSNDGSGETELQELRKEMARHGICIEFVIYLTSNVNINRQKMNVFKKSTSRVAIVCGHFLFDYIVFFHESNAMKHNFTLILNESWNVMAYSDIGLRETFNCSMIPVYPRRYIPGLGNFMDNMLLSNRLADPLLEDILLIKFNRPSSNEDKNKLFQDYLLNVSFPESTSYRVNDKYNSKFYFTYTAVYMLAQALHNMRLKRNKSRYKFRQTLRRYMRAVEYTSPIGEKISFDKKGELPSDIILANLICYDPTPGQFNFLANPFATSVTLPKMSRPEDFLSEFQWKHGKIPDARCNEPCPVGYRKAPTGGIHSCCYLCAPCSDGEISSVSDSDICQKCPDDQWPDEKKVKCVSKTYEHLSYGMDVMSQTFSHIAILCSVVTLYIMTLFIIFRNTPIVRANNWTVSFILLTSLLLSFLSVFLFLGRPLDITCMLRQISFGISFTIAVSSVLAKTITVCIAFKASKPGSYWRKWVGEKTSNYVALICSSVQVLICVIWLSVSPPYQEYDKHSYPGKIIIQCNEGSVIGFYSVLGYMGFLAAVSFVLAFMVRTLPDSFNEAKYITFSMLLFCSVWISMIPAYLSTKGKYMVAVEIFAILASSAGFLGCIFFPKCYIIIIKPERNSKKLILSIIKS